MELVQKCVFNHRESVNLEKLSKEELCVADADAISHFDSVPSFQRCCANQEIAGEKCREV